MGDKVAQTIEGLVDVPFVSDPVAPQIERVEKSPMENE
jgi:hypothetical protein